MRKDRFTEEALKNAQALAALKYSEDYEDQLAYAEAYDFARCQRPDGSFYGTGGQCRKGKETGDSPAKKETPRQKFNREELESPKNKADMDHAGLMKLMAKSPTAQRQLKEELKRRRDSEDVRRKDGTLIGTSPRNMLIDNIKMLRDRLDDARSDAERKLLRDSLRKATAQLKSEGG